MNNKGYIIKLQWFSKFLFSDQQSLKSPYGGTLRQKSTTNDVDGEQNIDSNSFASDLVSSADSAVTAANNTSVAAAANTNLPVTANNDALDAELDELVNENNTISQHLNLPLSTNNVAINVNNYGNNLSTVFFLHRLLMEPVVIQLKNGLRKWCREQHLL